MTNSVPVDASKSWGEHISHPITGFAVLEQDNGRAHAADRLNFSSALGLPENITYKNGHQILVDGYREPSIAANSNALLSTAKPA